MAKNTLKNSLKSEEQPKPKKKKSSVNGNSSLIIKLRELKHNSIEFFYLEKNKQIFGLMFLFLAAIMTISFVSYYFAWAGNSKAWIQDQSEILRAGNGFTYILSTSYEGNSWMGKGGAYLGHFFLYAQFGISSFLFVILLFLSGLRLAFKNNLYPLKKAVKLTFIFSLWGTSFFSLLSSNSEYTGDLGGGIGFHINEYLFGVMGTMGTALLLILLFFIIIMISFDFNLNSLKDLFPKPEEKDSTHENESNESSPAPLNTVKENQIPIQEETTSFQKEVSSTTETTEIKQDIPSSIETDSVSIPSNEKEIKIDLTQDIELNISEEKTSELIEDLTSESNDGIELPLETLTPTNKPVEADLTLQVEEVKEEEVLSEKDVNSLVKEFGEYDPKLDLGSFQLPPIDLLVDHGDGKNKVDPSELEANKNRIVETLLNYKIEISKIKATIGPTVTLYEIIPAPGVRISKIKNLEDDIALSLAALGIRIIAPIPGKGTVGIEVPNSKPDVVSMKAVISSEKFINSDMELPIALGKTIQNETYVTDLAKMPHLLMAGATGQGKSVGLNAILASLLYKKHPSQLKFVLVDPKKVELTLFNKIERHYLAKLPDTEEAIITDTSKVVQTANSLCVEMDNRYEMLKNAQCRNLKEYNAKFVARKLNPENGHKYLPYIVLVIDEFADLIMTAGKEIETPIARLAQLARAIGIHLIVATQRPSVNIITGTIKANFPARIAFRVTAKIDSRTILDSGGADQLIGRGDMLLSTGSEIIRIQCAFVDTPEVEDICNFIGEQRAYPTAHILPEFEDPNGESSVADIAASDRDVLFEEAARLVVISQQGSASMLQRKLKLGYNRAGRIVDQLEAAGIIGGFEGSKARKVLYPDEYSLEQFLNNESANND